VTTSATRRLAATGAVLATLGGLGIAAAGSPGSAGDAVLGPGRATATIDIEHSRFSTDRIVVAAGTLVTFVVDNSDPIAHELIVGPPEVHRRHATGTEAAHPPVPGEVTVPALEEATTAYTFAEPGTFTFACHLPGHVAYGMVGEVVVEGRVSG
jgi:uncharacterized cupredoxin-like copper-binding protein